MMIFIVILSCFVLVSLINVLTMPVFDRIDHQLKGKVSILIPMRNEEKNVFGLVESLKKIEYPQLEFIILNDQSTDQTEEFLRKAIAEDSRFQVMEGNTLPEGWVGKVHACHQLGKAASGDFYLFLDADVRVDSKVIHQSMYIMEKYQSKLVTGFPRFPVKPFLGKLLVPLQHFFIFFHLPNGMANHTTKPAFTAAHGAFMFFEQKAYKTIGGHESVKNSLIEDIHITRMTKKLGFKATLTNITTSVTCYMYDTNNEVWEGFLKNIYVGLGRSPIGAVLVSGFYLLFYASPLGFALWGLLTNEWIWLVPLILVYIQTFIIDAATRQNLYHFLLMPFSAIALTILLWSSMVKSLKKKGYQWKGRVYK